MEISSIGATGYGPQVPAAARPDAAPAVFRDSERAERVPDDEGAEARNARAPLPSYSGNVVDIEA